REAATGCTVVLFDEPAVGGVDVRGAAPGTRETDLLRPGALVERIHAVLLCGGSAFGLAAADGVMRFLEERGVGHPTRAGVVPIVPAAVLYDLSVGSASRRPDAAAGYAACAAAASEAPRRGSEGAGTGATVGKILGMALATKGGVGSASLEIGDGVVVGALAAGNVGGSRSGRVIAGVRDSSGAGFVDAERLVREGQGVRQIAGSNTTLAIIA